VAVIVVQFIERPAWIFSATTEMLNILSYFLTPARFITYFRTCSEWFQNPFEIYSAGRLWWQTMQ